MIAFFRGNRYRIKGWIVPCFDYDGDYVSDIFVKMPVPDVIRSLKSDATTGLGYEEVSARQEKYGYNEIAAEKSHFLLNFLKKFWGLTAWLLEIIIFLSWLLQNYVDVAVVTGLLVLNSILSFSEERRSASAVKALQAELHVNARILRDGQWVVKDARELVPGDIIRARSGDFAPADAKIIDGNVTVDQSALTGESILVEKSGDDYLFSGSTIKNGEVSCIVVSTGVSTYFGKTTQLVQLARPKLHFESIITNVVRWLFGIVIALLAIAFLVAFLKSVDLLEILPLGLVVLLSAIPTALPVMLTITMALGSMELVRKGVLITRLNASEDAAGMDVICSDKTGTITANELVLASTLPRDGFTDQDVVACGAFASQEANQDPIDIAFLKAARQSHLLDMPHDTLDFTPFDPSSRRTEATIDASGETFKVMKGATRTIMDICGIDAGMQVEIESSLIPFSSKGYRAIAVARSADDGSIKLAGFAFLYDAPRQDSKEAIDALHDLGISIKMLTGDALPVAVEISKEIGMPGNIVRISDVKQMLSEKDRNIMEMIERSDGFAEIYPEDKYTIIKAFQDTNHIVGMTGDGVNDAPALKQAEVGIAVANATDIAKAAASVVLTNPGLSGIVNLVRTGRKIYERVVEWILNKITRTFQQTCVIVFAFLFTGRFIISTFGMILILFTTDFVKITLSTDNVKGQEKPVIWNVRDLVKVALVVGMIAVMESFAMLTIGFAVFNIGASPGTLETFSYEMLFFSAIFTVIALREKHHFWVSRPSKPIGYSLLFDAIFAVIISLTGLFSLAPIPIATTAFIICFSAIFFLIVNDFAKVSFIRRAHLTW